jgi:hypothetical protein
VTCTCGHPVDEHDEFGCFTRTEPCFCEEFEERKA